MHIPPRIRLALAMAAAALCVSVTGAHAADVPSLTRHATDLAGVMSPERLETLDRLLAEYERSTSNQFVVLIIPSLGGQDIESYSLAVAEKNRIGRAGSDNGVLLCIAIQDRSLRFEIGYGLEGVLTDALTSIIIRDVIAPAFKAGDFDGGVIAGMQAAMQAASGEFTPPPPQNTKEDGGGGSFVFLIILIVLVTILRRRGRGGRGPSVLIFPGGFGGGGFSGGGFGGGGFSGGGGSFGGGGSSGSW